MEYPFSLKKSSTSTCWVSFVASRFGSMNPTGKWKVPVEISVAFVISGTLIRGPAP
jgi:hypothetical protein